MRGLVALLLLGCAMARPAHAAGLGPGLDRIQAERTLRCGSVARTGYAEAREDGGVGGVAVDVCRAVAVALLGPGARVLFTLYEAPHSFDALRRGEDELAFLTGSDIAEQTLASAVLPGPTVAFLSSAVMVPQASAVVSLEGLAGQVVCFMTGSPAHRALEAAAAARHVAIGRLAFQETVEMDDAYNAGRCGAVVGDTADLAALRQTPGVRGRRSRVLPEPLALDPLVVVTPMNDGPLLARAGWVMAALLLADAPANAWQFTGAEALPTRGLAGLQAGWQADVQKAVGSYGAILARNLTQPLGLPPGANAPWPAGLLLSPAIR